MLYRAELPLHIDDNDGTRTRNLRAGREQPGTTRCSAY